MAGAPSQQQENEERDALSATTTNASSIGGSAAEDSPESVPVGSAAFDNLAERAPSGQAGPPLPPNKRTPAAGGGAKPSFNSGAEPGAGPSTGRGPSFSIERKTGGATMRVPRSDQLQGKARGPGVSVTAGAAVGRAMLATGLPDMEPEVGRWEGLGMR